MSAVEPDPPEGPEITAGEYVLGVLAPEAHAAAARRARVEPAFADQVADWEARLTPLALHVAAQAPPPGVWPAIARRIAPESGRPAGLWDSLGLWRGLALGASALAAASIAVVILPRSPAFLPPPAVAPAPPLIAVARLDAPGGGAAVFVATLDEGRHRLIVTPTGRPGRADRSPQLWLMPDKATPVPLGVFMGANALVVSAPVGVTGDALLGVSLEPLGGSPTGAPSGPVIAVGRLMRL